MSDLNHYQPQAVDWLLGACLMIRREVLDTVGPLDEGFYLYVEDIDWAKRIHQVGWQVFYVPMSQIIHHHLAVSDKQFLSRYMWLHFQSMIRYVRKHLLPPIPLLAIRKNNFEVWQLAHRQSFDLTN
jgi:GT2 family glycosyltransferase